MAAAVNPTCEAAVKDMLSYIDKNSDVWIGAIWWAAVCVVVGMLTNHPYFC